MPTFGRDSIRRFTNSVSELKKLGARDYENLLQVSKFIERSCALIELWHTSALYLFLKGYCLSHTTDA